MNRSWEERKIEKWRRKGASYLQIYVHGAAKVRKGRGSHSDLEFSFLQEIRKEEELNGSTVKV